MSQIAFVGIALLAAPSLAFARGGGGGGALGLIVGSVVAFGILIAVFKK